MSVDRPATPAHFGNVSLEISHLVLELLKTVAVMPDFLEFSRRRYRNQNRAKELAGADVLHARAHFKPVRLRLAVRRRCPRGTYLLLSVSMQARSAVQIKISRLRAELARVKMERDILGKATAAQAACAKPVLIEVRLHQPSSPRVADLVAVPSAGGQRGRAPRAIRACGQRGATAPSQDV